MRKISSTTNSSRQHSGAFLSNNNNNESGRKSQEWRAEGGREFGEENWALEELEEEEMDADELEELEDRSQGDEFHGKATKKRKSMN